MMIRGFETSQNLRISEALFILNFQKYYVYVLKHSIELKTSSLKSIIYIKNWYDFLTNVLINKIMAPITPKQPFQLFF